MIALIEQVRQRLEAAGVSFGHGTTDAFDEAAWLVLWRLGLPLDELDEHAARPVDAAAQEAVESLTTERIETRQPLAYLTGEAWLQGLPFHIDRRSIVPRSLIAEVIADGTLDAWLVPQARQVLDLCTGNGSLAVLAALAWPEARVLATDLSADALAVADRNIARYGLRERVTLARGDGWAAAPGRFDLVLCNPPYVSDASMAALPAEYRAEPVLALAGGVDGMDFIRPVLAEAAAHLSPHGVFVLEIGHERGHFEAAFPKLQPVWLSTSAGDDQVLLLTQEELA